MRCVERCMAPVAVEETLEGAEPLIGLAGIPRLQEHLRARYAARKDNIERNWIYAVDGAALEVVEERILAARLSALRILRVFEALAGQLKPARSPAEARRTFLFQPPRQHATIHTIITDGL